MRRMLLALALMATAHQSPAAPISFAGYSWDGSSNVVIGGGLQWLRWTETDGMSIDTAKATYGGDGWVLASNVQMAARFSGVRPDLVLTSEAGGIAPALACASELDLPMVYAKKYVRSGNRHTFAREVSSPTKGFEYRVEVARRVLRAGTRVLIVDDFLSRGRTAEALGDIAEEAQCELVGFGFVIEKTFQGGRARLEARGWNVASLVIVESMTDGKPQLAGYGTGAAGSG